MDSWSYWGLLVTPLVGAVIGILTNFIAVLMLFRPYNAVYIGKLRIPFTPGIIPARQKALGKALGKAVSESLIRKEDLRRTLLSEDFTNTVVNGVLSMPSIKTSAKGLFPDEYDEKREWLLEKIADKILDSIKSMNVDRLITKEATAIVQGFSAKNPLIGIFLTDAVMAQLTEPIGERLVDYLEGDGRERLILALSVEVEKMETKPVGEWMDDTETMRRVITSLYQRIVERHADSIAAHFKIAETVEEKVNAMPPEALEEMVLSVMKKELSAVIWLGGLIGFVMGLLNYLTPILSNYFF